MDLGYSKFVLKDDQEPAIKALREAVIRRINAIRGDVHIQVITEESPVGESQSNGDVESAIKQTRGQSRTMRLSTQSNYQQIVQTTMLMIAGCIWRFRTVSMRRLRRLSSILSSTALRCWVGAISLMTYARWCGSGG